MKRAWLMILCVAVLGVSPGTAKPLDPDRHPVEQAVLDTLGTTSIPEGPFVVRDLRMWEMNEKRLREMGAMVGEFPLPKETDALRPRLIDRCLRSPLEAVRVGLGLAAGKEPKLLQWLASTAPRRKKFTPPPLDLPYGCERLPRDFDRLDAVWTITLLRTVLEELEEGHEAIAPAEPSLGEVPVWMLDGIDSARLREAREVFDRHAAADCRPILRRILVELPGSLGPLTTLLEEGPWPRDKPRRVESEAGVIVLGTMGDDLYEEDAWLLIDPGGNDVYRNNAGGARNSSAMLIDLAGDDRYESEADFVQGAALNGVGILIDLAGDDHYQGKNFCQGVAVGGVGVLMDLSGNDVFVADSFAQGAAALGCGVLWSEGDGDDRYEIGRLGQGLGRTAGLGVLRDLGGNDRYVARPQYESMYSQWTGGRKVHWSFAQGCGFGFYCRYEELRADGKKGLVIRELIPGGVGLIADDAGDDVYEGSMYAQGTAYFYGLGICLDRAGNDRYTSTWYGQGAAPHFAAGILVDAAGDDEYRGMNQVQGNGRDFSTAVLLDLGGNDRYFGEDRVQGCGDLNDSYGIFVDAGGDDRYEAVKRTARGFATNTDPKSQPTEERPYADFGVFLDLGGEDEYVGPAKGADGEAWAQKQTGRGVGRDFGEDDR